MQLERTKNAKKNILFGFINKIVNLLYPFIIRTIVIHEIGAEFLGLSSLFSSILQVLNLTELGFSSAVVFSMYKPIADNDNDTLCAILNFYRKVYFVIGIIIFSIGMAMLPFIPKLIKGDLPKDVNIYLLYIIYLVNTVISYLMFAYRFSLLNAYQRTDVISNINTITFLFVYTLQLLIVIFTKNYYLYALCLLISTIINNVLAAVFTKKLFPNIYSKGTISKILKKEINEKIKGLMISKINGISRNALDSIFLSLFLGLIETAKYNNYYYISNAVTGIMLIVYSSLLGGVGNSVAVETQEKNYEDLIKMNFIYMWIAGWFSILLLCLYQPFTSFFFGDDMLFPISVVVMFCMYFYVLKMGDILCLYSEANGLWWKMRFISYAETISNILLNYFLGKYFGAIGIIAGTLISLILITNSCGGYLVFRNYFTKYKYSKYLLSLILYLVVTVIVAVVCYSLTINIKINPIGDLIIISVICTIIPNLLYLLIYKHTNIYRKSMPWFLSVFKIDRINIIKKIFL